MGNITNLLGHQFVPPAEKYIKPADLQLRDSMIEHGLTPPLTIHLDGKLRRFSSGTRGEGGHGSKSAWYVAFLSDMPAGKFGDFRTGIEVNFRADIGRGFTQEEDSTHFRRISEAKAIRDEELEKSRALAVNTVSIIWEGAMAANIDHGYLVRKGIYPNGARVTGDGRLIVPLYDLNNQLSSLQYISLDGEKRYHTGGATVKCFHTLGTDEKKQVIYVAEGFATAATIYEQTGQLVFVAYSASNLPNVVEHIRNIFGASQDVCVVADNDESGVGLKYADQASAKHGCRVVMPPDKGDANDYKQAGGDLMALLQPAVDNWLVSADDFSFQPSPISWLIKGWLQEQALIMVHGPSGGGKTFVVLDWCLNIASTNKQWFDNKVKDGSVVYLAGEGHHGLRGRIAAWKQHNQVTKLNMWLSRDGCNLNTPEGYNRVLKSIRDLPAIPKLIVVDTLHRFLLGDENKSQDAKSMLDACSALMSEFNCSVALVHHTGVNEDAQHRARGSSAWRGALDIEISIVPATESKPIEIVQRKSKDAELVATLYCNLQSLAIDGWFDEDSLPVTSAIVTKAEKGEEKNNINRKLEKFISLFCESWTFTDCEVVQKMPYVSRAGMLNFLIEKKEFSERTAKNKLIPGRDGDFIADLINFGKIEICENGWRVIDGVISSPLMLVLKAQNA